MKPFKLCRAHRAYSWVLLTVLVLSSLLLCSYTETDDFFRYERKEDGTAEIVGYTGFDSTVRFPSELHGYTVTSIGDTALYGNEEVRKIILSSGISSIGKDAFAYCPNLNTVVFEDGSGVFIGESAFEGCALLQTVTFSSNLLTIDDFAFNGCVRLEEVTLPSSLESIGYDAFGDCESLILDCKESAVGLSYANENHISTERTDSSTVQFLTILLGSLLVLAAVYGGYRVIKRKRSKNEEKN